MMEQLWNINDHLDRISLLLNQNLNLQLDGINYRHRSETILMPGQLIQNFLPILDRTIKIYRWICWQSGRSFIISFICRNVVITDQMRRNVLRYGWCYLIKNSLNAAWEQLEQLTIHCLLHTLHFPSNEDIFMSQKKRNARGD